MVLKKSQRVLSFMLTLVMLLALNTVFGFQKAGALADGEWTYEQWGSGANIVGYTGANGVVTVPAKVAGLNVVKVSALSTNYFKTSITSVTFSNGIKELGDSVCKGYSGLTRVSLPDTLTTIAKDAFFGCTSLPAIKVPNSVTSIGQSAFANCTELLSADLSCKATVIPDELFSGDIRLNTISLPTYTETIGKSAFFNCGALRNVNIPDRVNTIDTSAFSNCTGITSINMPSELRTIADQAFRNCSSLTSIYVPGKTRSINKEAFADCTSLKTAYISSSVQIIKSNIFSNCQKLETIIFGGDNYNFNDLSTASLNATAYYPAKYAANWANFYSVPAKSYQVPSVINVSGTTTAYPGQTVNLKISTNGDFNNLYSLSNSNPTVATVTGNGDVFARSAGSTTITITSINGLTKTVDIAIKPDAPSGVDAVSKTTTSANITWKSVYNVDGYNVYRSTSKNGTYKKVGSSTSTSYTDKGLTKGKTYYYKVAAYVNANGGQTISNYSSVVSVKAAAPAPATITAKKSKAGVAKITWSKSSGASGYEVYMATSSKGKFTKISTISKPTTLSCTKSGLTKGRTYYFKVRSYTTVNGKKVYSDYTSVKRVKV